MWVCCGFLVSTLAGSASVPAYSVLFWFRFRLTRLLLRFRLRFVGLLFWFGFRLTRFLLRFGRRFCFPVSFSAFTDSFLSAFSVDFLLSEFSDFLLWFPLFPLSFQTWFLPFFQYPVSDPFSSQKLYLSNSFLQSSDWRTFASCFVSTFCLHSSILIRCYISADPPMLQSNRFPRQSGSVVCIFSTFLSFLFAPFSILF